VAAAGSMLAVKHLSTRYDPWLLTGMQAAVGAVFFAPMALASNPMTWLHASPVAWGCVAYLGIAVSLAAFGLYNSALSLMPASRASLAINVIPAVALIAGWALLGESLSAVQLVACVVIVGAVVFAESGAEPVPIENRWGSCPGRAPSERSPGAVALRDSRRIDRRATGNRPSEEVCHGRHGQDKLSKALGPLLAVPVAAALVAGCAITRAPATASSPTAAGKQATVAASKPSTATPLMKALGTVGAVESAVHSGVTFDEYSSLLASATAAVQAYHPSAGPGPSPGRR